MKYLSDSINTVVSEHEPSIKARVETLVPVCGNYLTADDCHYNVAIFNGTTLERVLYNLCSIGAQEFLSAWGLSSAL